MKLKLLLAVCLSGFLTALVCSSCRDPSTGQPASKVVPEGRPAAPTNKKGAGGLADPTVHPAPPGVKTGTP
jgi:hypothetical protein